MAVATGIAEKSVGSQHGKLDFVDLLRTCARRKDLHEGAKLHADIIKKGLLGKNPFIASTLIDMYAKCGVLAKAQQVLEELPVRDVVTWSALIGGYAQHGQGHKALDCFERMEREGLSPDGVAFTCVLKACGSIRAIDRGRRIHEEIVKSGFLSKNIILGNALVDMYAKCGALEKAQQVLEELPMRNVISWNGLIAGYAQQEQGDAALCCYRLMQREGVSPNEVTFLCILKACGSIGAVEKGKQIHEEIINRGLLHKNTLIGNALVDMYAKCGMLERSQQVLEELFTRNVVSWSALISGYVQAGQGHEALNCFMQMKREGISPNAITFTSIVKACGMIGAIDKGVEIHEELVAEGLLEKNIELGNALIDMYAKCGVLEKSQQVLNELHARNVVSWSALIAGYTQNGDGKKALNCYAQMQREGLSPNEVTFTCILNACSSTGAIGRGKQIHNEIVNRGLLERNVALGNALVDMYAKCGVLSKAHQVLEELPVRNIVSWNALIAGYAQEGKAEEALNCFASMQRDGLSPNGVTLLSVLSACSHSGKLDEAQIHYDNMSRKHGIKPELEHHTCMVMIFGCSGCFEKAISLIKAASSANNPSLWLALLGACKRWEKVKLGRLAFDQVLQQDSSFAAAYVIMSSIYANAGMMVEAEKIESMRVRYGAVKKNIWMISSHDADTNDFDIYMKLRNSLFKTLEE